MSLEDILRQRIREGGPMTVAEWMTACLTHPVQGYYTTRDPLGAAGDFTTAPEISQIFGEVIGAALAAHWRAMGEPCEVHLIELGPGRGTLMADMLRVLDRVPGLSPTVHLIEISPALRARQAETLSGREAHWHDDLSAVPAGPTLLLANEFLDALPIRQHVRDGEGWRERVVGLDGDAFAFGLTPPAPLALLDHRRADTKGGDLVETRPAADAVAARIGDRLRAAPGAALLVDYGDWRSQGDTLQALREHRRADPLHAPGTADLTAHVDFEPVARAAGVAHSLLTPQGVFLERLGITERARALAGTLSGPALDALVAAHRRLAHPDEMGTLFKVLALASPGGPLPPGLDAARGPAIVAP